MRQIHHSLLLTNHTSFGKGTRMQGPYRHKVIVGGGGGEICHPEKREKNILLWVHSGVFMSLLVHKNTICYTKIQHYIHYILMTNKVDVLG